MMMNRFAIGAGALVAMAGSAIGAIVTGPGSGSNCATFEGTTATTITYSGFTDGSWSGRLNDFRINVTLFSTGPTTFYSTPISLVEYSLNAGGAWSPYSGISSTFASSSTFGPLVSFSSPGPIVGVGNFLVRVTIDANPSQLINNRLFQMRLNYNTDSGGGTNGRSSTVVPTPGAAAMLGLGGLLAVRRRRVANA
ncbi:MAG: hypothetical protein NTV94_00070 [Planctomycetota bacterium]|nr:hypothetical protein [Planctomycetota bacterium]